MSATATATPSKKRKGTRLLKSPIAKVSISLINGIVPLIFLRLAWNGLLLDPSATLTVPLLPSIFIVQTTFIVLLLPFYVSSSNTTKSVKQRNVVKMDTLGNAIKSKAYALIQSIFFLLPATLLFYITIILFGAPLTTHTPQTLLTSLHIALLTTYPLSISIIPTRENMRRLVTTEYEADIDVVKWTYAGAIGTIIGAWLGAVPIPLDWDREWQKWPITIIVGAYLGHAAGLLLGIAMDALKGGNVEKKEKDDDKKTS